MNEVSSQKTHDPHHPDPWHALALDRSTFFDEAAKQALLRNNASRSRQFLLPIIRPLARASIVIIQLLRIVIPKRFTSSKLLHAIIVWGMRYVVSSDANALIFRHFHIGSQILRFLGDNLNVAIQYHPLKPERLDDFRNNTFVQHDLNIYNFVIEANQALRDEGRIIAPIPIEQIDFSAIQDFESSIEPLPNRWHNFLDLQSAIELYTPLFGVFLSDEDFWRASNSLQLDETIAIYIATLFNQPSLLSLVNNKHPMVPLSTLEAGFRLMLHGLDAENLYGFIKAMRIRAQELGDSAREEQDAI